MSQVTRFIVALLAGLGVLTLVGYVAVAQTMRGWFEKDVALRSDLAVASARQSLARSWNADGASLAATLADITHDERITRPQVHPVPVDLTCRVQRGSQRAREGRVLQDVRGPGGFVAGSHHRRRVRRDG